MGFVFRIYLSRSLGAEMMGVYQVSMSVFMVLMTLTTSGIPLVVSRKTAAYSPMQNPKEQHSLVTMATTLSTAISIGLCLLIFLFQSPLSKLFARPESMPILIMLLPAVVSSAVCAAVRGNLWGHKKFSACSSIELVEQIVRIVICVFFIQLSIGNKAEMTALSLSVACIISMFMCIVLYFKNGGKFLWKKGVVKPLFRESAGITGMRVASSLLGSAIALIVPATLIAAGSTDSAAMATYGAASGMALPLLYLPSTAIGALAYALVPEIASIQSQGKEESIRSKVESSIIFSIIISAIFIPLFMGLGEEIGVMIYANAEAGHFLKYAAWIMIPIAIEQITSSVMNSLNLEFKGFINYLIGTVFLFASVLIFTRYIGIHAFSIGLGISLTFSSILDIIEINKKVHMKGRYIKPLAVSVLFCVPCTLLAYFVNNILILYIPTTVSVVIAGIVGVAMMAGLCLTFKLIDISAYLPKGKKKKLPLAGRAKEIVSKSFSFWI